MTRTPSGLRLLEITHVAYVPGFLTNLLALSRCRLTHIHFDSGRDLLYHRQPGNVIAHLDYLSGHWYIDADATRRPKLAQLVLFAAKYRPSKQPKQTQEVSV